jgi:hypothetical protein
MKDKFVFKLDPEEIEREIKAMYTNSVKLLDKFPKSIPTCHKLINEVNKEIVEF